MHDAGEPRSVYGNPPNRVASLPFLRRSLLRGLASSFYASRSFHASPSPSPQCSHILLFCTFAISAIAQLAAPAAVTVSRGLPRWFQMIPLSATRSGRMRDVGDSEFGSERDFHYDSSRVWHRINDFAITMPHSSTYAHSDVKFEKIVYFLVCITGKRIKRHNISLQIILKSLSEAGKPILACHEIIVLHSN